MSRTKVTLCRLDDLTDGGARRFDVDGRSLAVVRIGDDVYAIGDRCSHANISLSEGDVDCDERELECWKHGSTFSLLRVYATKFNTLPCRGCGWRPSTGRWGSVSHDRAR